MPNDSGNEAAMTTTATADPEPGDQAAGLAVN